MKKNKIFLFYENEDLKEISEFLKDSVFVDLNLKIYDLLSILKKYTGKRNIFVTDTSLKGLYISLFYRFLHKNEYFVWFEEYRDFKDNFWYFVPLYFSKGFITRTKQIRRTLNREYKKNIFVIFPWIKEKKYRKEDFRGRVYSNFNIELPNNWKNVDKTDKADIYLLKFEDGLFNLKIPKIIFRAIEYRKPVIIIYHKPKTVNKIFKYVKNVFVYDNEKNIDFYDLEYFANQSYKFKIPKKLRFKYNMSKLDKYLK